MYAGRFAEARWIHFARITALDIEPAYKESVVLPAGKRPSGERDGGSPWLTCPVFLIRGAVAPGAREGRATRRPLGRNRAGGEGNARSLPGDWSMTHSVADSANP